MYQLLRSIIAFACNAKSFAIDSVFLKIFSFISVFLDGWQTLST